MEFEKLKAQAHDNSFICNRCGSCVRGPFDPLVDSPDRSCPMYEQFRYWSHGPQGVHLMACALLDGTLVPDEAFIKAIYDCCLCSECYTACDEIFVRVENAMGKRFGHGCSAAEAVKAIRADLIKGGFEAPGGWKKTAAMVEKAHNRFGRPQADRLAWVPKGMELPKKAKLVYYPGCVAELRSQEIAQSFAKILQKAGVEFTTLGENEWCCGGPQLLNAGYVDAFVKNAEHNVKAIKDAGATEVVTTCADCWRSLKIDYPNEAGVKVDFKVLHSTELLAQLVQDGKIKMTKKLKGKVTFHDPCQLAKTKPTKNLMPVAENKVVDPARVVLEAVPGIELVEMMQGCKEYTMCCGHYPVELPEESMLASVSRLQDAKEVGAATVVTGCSFCKWALGRANAKDSGIAVLDIAEVVAQAMGL